MAESIVFGSIGLVGQCYSGAIQAYLTLQRCIDFPDTSGKLVLQLEVQRIRLQLWGRNSGADEEALRPGLSPFEPLIKDILNRITKLLQDSDRLKEEYGLVSRANEGEGDREEIAARVETRKKAIDQVKNVFSSVFAAHGRRGTDTSTQIQQPTRNKPPGKISPYDRIRWAISSQSRFEAFVADLRSFVDNLNELLRESQQTSLSQDWRLLELQTVADIDDPQALQEIQKATEGDASCRAMYSMARRKLIVIAKRGHTPTDPGILDEPVIKVLSEDDFDLPDNFRTLSRCISIHNPVNGKATDQGICVLIEKKYYDADISAEDKGKLLLRLHRLIELLNSPPGDSSGLLSCLGYWSEPESSCWCVAYRYPAKIQTLTGLRVSSSVQAPSLSLFLTSDAFKPPLESRLKLASTIVATFSHLYGSKWLHKGVRSENILFPLSGSGLFDISKSFVVGFEYSRQYSEQTTIDRTPFNFAHAMYRHPNYQGLAAKGYKMSYDMYSLGLVLAEIAWWMPLSSLHAGLKKSSREEPITIALNQGQRFGVEEAMEMRKVILKRVRKELAFRVGSTYKDVVEWCLTCGDLRRTESELVVDFYTNVVVPLESPVH